MAATTSATTNLGSSEREVWNSRLPFYAATISVAVGFEHVWRFPALSVRYGGGAFFIPYLLALVLIGILLTILEIEFGQYFQAGDIGGFGEMKCPGSTTSRI
jgi:SNF family Na+-dependent transporter